MKENCIMCNGEIDTEQDSYAVGESLGEYWCYDCGMEEVERMAKENKDHKLGFDNLA